MFVFVYGTLLTGQGNHRLLSHITDEPSRNMYIYGNMYHLGGFPGVINVGMSNNIIKGEVYDVDSDTLANLDSLEGYRGDDYRDCNMYNRVRTNVHDYRGYIMYRDVYVYEYNTDRTPLSPIKSGDWLNQDAPPIEFSSPLEEDFDEVEEDFMVERHA